MREKIFRVGLIFLCILLSLKNNLYAYMMTSEEEIQNYNIVNVMIICFFLFIALLMIVFAIYMFPKLGKKDDDNIEGKETDKTDKIDKYSKEGNVCDENQIRYLVATLILLFPVLYIVYILITTGFAPIGLLILAVLLIYNCLKKYTHLERFYHNAKLVVPLIFLFFLYVVIFN